MKVAFEVGAGRRVSGVRALRSDAAVMFEQSGITVRFAVPSIRDYQVIAVG